jgi:long-chain acyl-CoA synthetase
MSMPSFGFWNQATQHPDDIAVVEPDGRTVTFAALHAQANRIAHGLHAAGLRRGDCIAIMLENRSETLALFMAVAQSGLYLTPLNTHLAPPEAAYIVQDCEARVTVCSARTAELMRRALDSIDYPAERRFSVDPVDGFRPLSDLTDGQPATPPAERWAGTTMTYTSGTTGRPKGVRRPFGDLDPETVSTRQAMFLFLFGITPRDHGVHLVVAPLYHTAVINFASNHLHLGHTVVLMDRWTPEGMLDRITRYRVTTTHMVPTMFTRLLKLPQAVRDACDVSSLRHMIHGAAPCPIEVKRQMLQWWGDTVYEYYAASEGGGTLATPSDWRARPGTVGKPWPISRIRILDDQHQPVPAGTPGTVWIAMGEHTFKYHKDDKKTSDSWRDGFFTVGDAGFVDADGFLFLCDRKADMIIAGGVNIYPAEIESTLSQHPAVDDVAVFGVPDDDMGEAVKAVVQPAAGREPSPELAAEITAWAAERLAKYKLPRTIDFIETMPRDPNGKLYKRTLRDPWWSGRSRGGVLPG